ncbi:MAG: SDR family oxidoreductase [Dehalococcoidales bacterium]|nr:SDR family oxidoreductase [Dehalococcoidales bacterium]
MALNGKVALVTGARQGLGRAIALGLANAGADIMVADRVLEDGKLANVAKEIQALGRRAVTSGGDISVEADVEAMVNKATSELGKVDILVNNAGVTAQDRFVDMPLRRWNLIINVNLNGSAFCAHAVLPQMIERNSGIIINMSSILALRVQYSVPYGATKAAIERFTTGMARELRKTNVSVTAMRPYFVKTEVVSDFLDGRSDMSDWEEPAMWGKYCSMIAAADPATTTGKIFDQALCKETFGEWK